MGLSAFGSLVAIALAYATHSPGFQTRAGLSGQRLILRLRLLTGLALALQLMTFGFFLAGVPIGQRTDTAVLSTPAPTITATPETAGEIVALLAADETATASALASPTPTITRLAPTGPSTGAFGGPPAAVSTTMTVTLTRATAVASVTVPTVQTTAAATATFTPPPLPTVTPTPTPTPTLTPFPTLTPTPIVGETAVVRAGSSNTIPVQHIPEGQTLARLFDGDVVILLPGHANYGGRLWRQINTVTGITGWILETSLEFTNPN